MRGCICRGNRRVVSRCGSNIPCEERCKDECDVLAQDCIDPKTPKCATIVDASGEHDRCVQLVATPKQENEPCTRFKSPTAGIDDCDKGLFCSEVRAENGKPPERRCRRHCYDGGPCPDGQICILSRDTGSVQLDLALCRDRCTFGQEGACGAGARCSVRGGCIAGDGTDTIDSFCLVEGECKSPLACDLVRNRCVPTCAPGRPCPDGYTCRDAAIDAGAADAAADAGAADAGDGGAPAATSLCVKNGS